MKENKGINEILNTLNNEDLEMLASYISAEVRDAFDEGHELEDYEVLEKDYWIEKLKPIEYMVAPKNMAKILLDLGFMHQAKGNPTLEGPYHEDVFYNALHEGFIKIRFVNSPTNRYTEVSISKDSSSGACFRFPLVPKNDLIVGCVKIEFVRTYSASKGIKEVDADDDVDYEGNSFIVRFSIDIIGRSYLLEGVSKYKNKTLFSYRLQ